MITIMTVIGTKPWNSSVRASAMAVVIDFGRRETYSVCPILNRMHMPKMKARFEITPQVIPPKIAYQFFFSFSNCSYKGTARQTVDGVKKNPIQSPPLQ